MEWILNLVFKNLYVSTENNYIVSRGKYSIFKKQFFSASCTHATAL